MVLRGYALPAEAQEIGDLPEPVLLAPNQRVAGPATIVVPYPASSQWRASVANHRLSPTVALGWAQAFRVPAGVAGPVNIYGPRRHDRLPSLVLEGLLVLAAVAALVRPTRTAPPAAPITLDDSPPDIFPPDISPPEAPQPSPRQPSPNRGSPAARLTAPRR
jgi:hypothetical protein